MTSALAATALDQHSMQVRPTGMRGRDVAAPSRVAAWAVSLTVPATIGVVTAALRDAFAEALLPR